MRNVLMAALVVLSPLAALAHPSALPPPPPGEGIKNRIEMRDDFRDAMRYQRLLEDFDQARRMRDFRRLYQVDARLDEYLHDELREGRHELRSEGREAYRTGAPEDRRDARQEARTLERVRELNGRFQAIRSRMGRFALDSKRAILVELIDLQHRELRQDRREAWEDHRNVYGRR